MKKLLAFALLLLAATPLPARPQAHRVDDIPLVHLQDRTRYVSNPDGILSPRAVAAMDTTLYALEQHTGVQTMVVAVRQIEGGDCFDFALELGQRNGVGQKERDNGLVILLVTGERCIQFVTGYGLEADLPDALCKQIQLRYMNPHLARADWDTGLTAGIQAIRRHLEGTGQPPAAQHDADGGTPWLLIALLACCFILLPALLWRSARQRTRCPRCGRHALKPHGQRTVSRQGGYTVTETLYRCTHCGYALYRRTRRRDDDDFHHRGGSGFPFLGGPFPGGGFGGGGGSFTGGSFGGGSFGGGGAGSRF